MKLFIYQNWKICQDSETTTSCKTNDLLKLHFFTFLSTDLEMEARDDRQRFHGQLFGRLLVSITVVTPDLGSRAQVLGLRELLQTLQQ